MVLRLTKDMRLPLRRAPRPRFGSHELASHYEKPLTEEVRVLYSLLLQLPLALWTLQNDTRISEICTQAHAASLITRLVPGRVTLETIYGPKILKITSYNVCPCLPA